MQKQSGRTTAIYYRTASRSELDMHLDNQMQKLLCYVNTQGVDSFKIYNDIGISGLTLDRPAFNALTSDIEAGHVEKLIVCNSSRIARGFILCENFIEWVQTQGIEIISITEGVLTNSPLGNIKALSRALLEGGER